jgi:hypothetical protein
MKAKICFALFPAGLLELLQCQEYRIEGSGWHTTEWVRIEHEAECLEHRMGFWCEVFFTLPHSYRLHLASLGRPNGSLDESMHPVPIPGSTNELRLEPTHCPTFLTPRERPLKLFHAAFQGHAGFDRARQGHLPYFSGAFLPYLILNSNKIFKSLTRKSSLNHLFIFISIPVIKENLISEIFSCTYQNPPSHQSISITITVVPCCCCY